MVWAWASENGTVLSRNWASLARPKYLSIAEPQIEVAVEATLDGTLLHLSCAKPAPYVVLALKDGDARFDDNFFHLHPGEKRTIKMTAGPAALSPDQLKIRSLADWMPARKTADTLSPRPPGYELQRKR
jgi:hypothetical protein